MQDSYRTDEADPTAPTRRAIFEDWKFFIGRMTSGAGRHRDIVEFCEEEPARAASVIQFLLVFLPPAPTPP